MARRKVMEQLQMIIPKKAQRMQKNREEMS